MFQMVFNDLSGNAIITITWEGGEVDIERHSLKNEYAKDVIYGVNAVIKIAEQRGYWDYRHPSQGPFAPNLPFSDPHGGFQDLHLLSKNITLKGSLPDLSLGLTTDPEKDPTL